MKQLFEITEMQKNIVQVAGVGYQAGIDSGCLVEVRGPGKAIIISELPLPQGEGLPT